MLRNMDKANPRKFRNPKSYDFPKGTTGLFSPHFFPLLFSDLYFFSEILSEEVIIEEEDDQEDNDFFSQFEKMEI